MRQLVRVWLWVVLLAAGPLCAGEPPDKVRILAIVDASTPLTVDYRTSGNLARRLVMFGSLLDAAIQSSRDSANSARLREAVGKFDRFPVVETALTAAFRQTPYFQADVVKAAGSGDPDLAGARAQGYPFVLVVHEELAGFITAWEMATLSAFSRSGFELYDAGSGQRLAKGAIVGYASAKYPIDAAIGSADTFLTDYPLALESVFRRIYGDLNKDGHLHTMATRAGLGDKVPDLGSILARYESRFKTRFKVPRGWERVDTNRRYAAVLQPKNADKQKFGVRVDIDLLISEFSQDVGSVGEYASIFLEKAAGDGFELRADAPPPLDLTEPHHAEWLDRPDGKGRVLLLFRQLSPEFVVIYQCVFLEETDRMLAKYRDDIESLVNGSRVTVVP